MSEPKYDVVGIGNALVDVLAHAQDAFVAAQGMVKGAMTLIDAEQARSLYESMPPAVEMSGGSGANTIAGLASLGARVAYIGKVADDQLGEVFRHDIRAIGVDYSVPPGNGTATGRCLIYVTPDAQRTMQTYLGISSELSPEDVDEDLIAAGKFVFLEGYLWDQPVAKKGMLKAARASRKAGRKVALTLSDAFCVERFRVEFLDLIENYVDVLFANESEALSLFETDSLDEAVQCARAQCEVTALTRSEKGSLIVTQDAAIQVAAEPGIDVVDTTGAGDQYAAGFLYGLTRGLDLSVCGRIASIAAGEVISHLGPRPEVSLTELVRSRLDNVTA